MRFPPFRGFPSRHWQTQHSRSLAHEALTSFTRTRRTHADPQAQLQAADHWRTRTSSTNRSKCKITYMRHERHDQYFMKSAKNDLLTQPSCIVVRPAASTRRVVQRRPQHSALLASAFDTQGKELNLFFSFQKWNASTLPLYIRGCAACASKSKNGRPVWIPLFNPRMGVRHQETVAAAPLRSHERRFGRCGPRHP